MTPSIEWTRLKEELPKIFTDALEGVVTGAQEDIAAFTEEIAASSLNAAMLGDDARLDELQAQIQGIAEMSRLRAVDASWKATTQTVMAITRAVIATAVSVVVPGA